MTVHWIEDRGLRPFVGLGVGLVAPAGEVAGSRSTERTCLGDCRNCPARQIATIHDVDWLGLAAGSAAREA